MEMENYATFSQKLEKSESQKNALKKVNKEIAKALATMFKNKKSHPYHILNTKYSFELTFCLKTQTFIDSPVIHRRHNSSQFYKHQRRSG
jgi:hypothetical protein